MSPCDVYYHNTGCDRHGAITPWPRMGGPQPGGVTEGGAPPWCASEMIERLRPSGVSGRGSVTLFLTSHESIAFRDFFSKLQVT